MVEVSSPVKPKDKDAALKRQRACALPRTRRLLTRCSCNDLAQWRVRVVINAKRMP